MSKIKKGVLLSLMSFGMFLTLTSCGSKSNQFKATTTNETSITTTVANTTTSTNTTTFENTTT